jgi:hypothetical protein
MSNYTELSAKTDDSPQETKVRLHDEDFDAV